MKRHRAGALAWVASILLIPVQVIVALGWPNGYSLTRNAISDLGVTTCGEFSELGHQVREVCSPGHQFFNAGLVASGILILLGAVLLYGYWAGRVGRVGTVLMAMAGACVAAVGLAPWDVAPTVHDNFASLQAVVQWIAMVLIAIATGPGVFRKVTIAATVLSAMSFAVFVAALDGVDVPVLGLGGVERLAFDSLTLWTTLTGVAILVTYRKQHSTESLNTGRQHTNA